MDLIKKIKEKKEFSGLPDDLIENEVSTVISDLKKPLTDLSERDKKLLIKEVRAKLRKLTGQYQISNKRKKAISKLNFPELIKTHSSTQERLEIYPELKKIISNLNVKSILDLGCGLNPLVLASKKTIYNYSDIRSDELNLISIYFKEKNFKGKAYLYDLRSFSATDFPAVDLVLLFKVLDVIETKSNKITEKIISSLNSKYVLVSFATKKLSGKPMKFPRRKWFENLLDHKGLKYDVFNFPNEVFYLIYLSK